MTLKATGDLKLEGRNIKIEGQMNTDIKAGGQATLKAIRKSAMPFYATR